MIINMTLKQILGYLSQWLNSDGLSKCANISIIEDILNNCYKDRWLLNDKYLKLQDYLNMAIPIKQATIHLMVMKNQNNSPKITTLLQSRIDDAEQYDDNTYVTRKTYDINDSNPMISPIRNQDVYNYIQSL